MNTRFTAPVEQIVRALCPPAIQSYVATYEDGRQQIVLWSWTDSDEVTIRMTLAPFLDDSRPFRDFVRWFRNEVEDAVLYFLDLASSEGVRLLTGDQKMGKLMDEVLS